MGSSVEEAREGLRTVTRGTLLMMIGTIGFVAESFVTRVLLFRTLDPYLYSQLALAIPLAGLASAVGS
ncbi:MAG TPA: hypothetical protein VGS18_02140, partial [Thermoplasmata archaeon]|nr:hypothetical protein [Thermoplasmata archaeon]